jgi:asparagine synthetase B (glutamine-hydrolysing)
MNVRVMFSDPAQFSLDLPGDMWFASGLHTQAQNLLRARPTAAQAEALCRQIGDATIIRLHIDGERLVQIDAWRGITAGYEIFYALRPDGSILLSDSFRNILSEIPVAERAPSDGAVLDHFLFRAVPAPSSYSRAVSRLSHGDRLCIDVTSRSATISRFDAIDYAWKPGSTAEYLDRLDQALDQAMSWVRERKDLVSMFSGGVDSTLLQTYLGGDAKAVFYAPQSVTPGTPDPVDYARRAANLLNLKLEIRPLRDEDIWGNLEENIDRSAWPQRVIQTTMYADAFKHRGGEFLQGARGDGLFGAAGTSGTMAAARAAAGAPVLKLLSGLPGGAVAKRARNMLETARQLQHEPESPLGWAAGMCSRGFSDYGIIEQVVGSAAMTDRLSYRLAYASSRLGPAWKAAGRTHRHLEMGHWVDLWFEDATAFIRQLALAHGKRVHLPFLTTPMVAMAMSVPTHERYVKGLTAKHLLKGALKRRLPGYPVSQKKGITSMRIPATYGGADRSAIWEEYPVPDFLPEAHRATIRAFGSPMSHSALTYAMLMRRVMRHPKLTHVHGTRVLNFTGRLAAATRRFGETARQWLWLSATVPFQTAIGLA